MRLIIITLLTLITCLHTLAQDAPDQPKKEKKEKYPLDKTMFLLTHDRWVNPPEGIKIKPWSIGMNIDLFFDYPLGASPFSFAWGGGFTSHNVHSNAAFVYRVDSLGNTFTALEPLTSNYSRNKLTLRYLTLPIEFRLRTTTSPRLRFSAGGKVGYMVSNYIKIIDDDGKRKLYGIKNLDPFLYGVTAGIGVGPVKIYGFYALNEMFRKGKGEPGMSIYSIGINILPLSK